jgi:hypothetical protein
LIEIESPSSVEIIGEACFVRCGSFTSLTFESESKLSRIETYAFQESGLIEIVIPSSVEILCESCFFDVDHSPH